MVTDAAIPEARDELAWLEGTILAALRTWVLASKRGVAADSAIQAMFANLRATEASDHLDRFMRGLSKGCTRMIQVYCTCEPELSPDEVLLLDMFALLQEDRHEAATDLLQRIVTPAAAYSASGDALAIVQLLNAAHHNIARGPAALQRLASDPDEAVAASRLPSRLH
jgi:hypothetical protein